jgi:hypothetical protein
VTRLLPAKIARSLLALLWLGTSKAQANESDVLFILMKTNPLVAFSAFDPVNMQDKRGEGPVFKKQFLELETFNQIEVSPTLVYHQHTLHAVARNYNGPISPFASISRARAYEPLDGSDELRLKNTSPLQRTDHYALNSGLQYSQGDRWWSFALGYDYVRKRDLQSLTWIETRQALTAQYILFDRSYYPYIIAGFIGVDAGVGGVYSRFTPYIALQDDWLVGPDFHVYHDRTTHKLKIGGSLAGFGYGVYQGIFNAGYQRDHNGRQGGYLSLGVSRQY